MNCASFSKKSMHAYCDNQKCLARNVEASIFLISMVDKIFKHSVKSSSRLLSCVRMFEGYPCMHRVILPNNRGQISAVESQTAELCKTFEVNHI